MGRNWAWLIWLNAVMGAWEIAAPWIWGYAAVSPDALWNDVILGGLILAVGLWAAWAWYSWPSLWNVLFGIWLIAAPYLFRYSAVAPQAAWNDVIVGVLTILFAVGTSFLKPVWREASPQAT